MVVDLDRGKAATRHQSNGSRRDDHAWAGAESTYGRLMRDDPGSTARSNPGSNPGSAEVLAAGDDRPPWPQRTRAWAWLRDRPRSAKILGVVLAAVMLAAAGIGYRQAQPSPPRLVGASIDNGYGPWSGQGDPPVWSPGPDGRPTGAAVVGLTATVQLAGVGSQGVAVYGVSGPGVTPGNTVLATTTSDGPLTVSLGAGVRCGQVRLPEAPGAYGLVISVGAAPTGPPAAATRTADSLDTQSPSTPATKDRLVLPFTTAPELDQHWRDAVEVACGSWQARNNLTVTGVGAAEYPERTAIRAVLTVVNTGASARWRQLAWRDDLIVTRARTALPTGTSQVSIDVELARCEYVIDAAVLSAPGGRQSGTQATTADLLGLGAFVGPGEPTSPTPWAEGAGPTGVVIEPVAAGVLRRVLHRACGSLGPVVTLVGDVSARPAAGTISMDVTIDVTPGLVRSLRLQSVPATDADRGPNTLIPAWRLSEPLVPDRTGQVHTTLVFRSPWGAPCPVADLWAPPFDVIAQVPDGGSTRTVTVRQGIIPPANLADLVSGCPQ